MRTVFERIAEEWLSIDNADDREDRLEAQHAVRTLGQAYYTPAERAKKTARLARKTRLGNILRAAARQERRRIEDREGKNPWPPCLGWPFDLAT